MLPPTALAGVTRCREIFGRTSEFDRSRQTSCSLKVLNHCLALVCLGTYVHGKWFLMRQVIVGVFYCCCSSSYYYYKQQ